MRGTNFQGADLRGAVFPFALLHGTDFRCADLTGASFENASISLIPAPRNGLMTTFEGAIGVDLKGAIFASE
jgi:uncharacterized protein YjbI with pentapeptide repeats